MVRHSVGDKVTCCLGESTLGTCKKASMGKLHLRHVQKRAVGFFATAMTVLEGQATSCLCAF